MLYGLYESAQGAAAHQRSLEVVANNMANAGTAGFKRDLALAGHYRPHEANRFAGPPSLADRPGNAGAGLSPFDLGTALGRASGGNAVAATAIDFAQGPLVDTGGDLDVALAGPGFLQIQTPDGVALTRDGRFTTAPDGTLVTAAGGLPVLGAAGETLAVPAGAGRVTITRDGAVSASFPGGVNATLGRLAVVVPEVPTSLIKRGDGLLTATAGGTAPADPAGTSLRQGYIEGSGVDSVKETMAMLSASRGFETNVNLVKLQDDTLGRLLAAARPS